MAVESNESAARCNGKLETFCRNFHLKDKKTGVSGGHSSEPLHVMQFPYPYVINENSNGDKLKGLTIVAMVSKLESEKTCDCEPTQSESCFGNIDRPIVANQVSRRGVV
jgi:negative regulator of replication initiation